MPYSIGKLHTGEKSMNKGLTLTILSIVTVSLTTVFLTSCAKSPRAGAVIVTLPSGGTVDLEMINLPGGTFQMGSEKGAETEKPVHSVTIKPFAIGKYEVTQAQWESVMGGSNPSNNKSRKDLPVENVSWTDVQSFLRRLGNGYRLPTEAEWEYAARAGTVTEFYFGDDAGKSAEFSWFNGNATETRQVGTKPANPLGLFDIYGNVFEWCEDDWHQTYDGAPVDGRAWIASPRDSLHVLRGGSFSADEVSARSADRARNESGYRAPDVGFRLARSLP
jgi:eukaryotic-like serine/threonine-protein kinase